MMTPERRDRIDRCKALIAARLADGPVKSIHIYGEMREAGFGINIARDAAKELGVRFFTINLRQGLFWMTLPDLFPQVADEVAAKTLTDEVTDQPDLDGLYWDIDRIVQWVLEHRLWPLWKLKPSHVPCVWALDLLLWARKNEDEFRKKYEIPIMVRREKPSNMAEALSAKADALMGKTSQRDRHDRVIASLRKSG